MSHSHDHSRRRFLNHAGAATFAAFGAGSFGGLASAFASELFDPTTPRQPHHPAKAKAVIWLHMAGAPSTLDLFDYKPQLIKLSGSGVPASLMSWGL